MRRTKMSITDAKAECQRWLDYLDRKKDRSIDMQKIAADRMAGKCDELEGHRRLKALHWGVTVYDGAKLAEAVKFLMEAV